MNRKDRVLRPALGLCVLLSITLAAVLLPPVPSAVANEEIAGLAPTPAWTSQRYHDLGSVRNAGDLNGDDYPEVVVAGIRRTGMAHVYYGGPEGPGDAPDWEAGNGVWAADGAGDVNGDGFDDLITGAPSIRPRGRVAVHFGSAAGPSLTPDWRLVCDQEDALFGEAVASAGDVNGDGYADVIVGAPDYDVAETDQGRAYVYYGSPEGPRVHPHWAAAGDLAYGYFGSSVASAGDVNGDGYGDVIVGAPGSTDHSVPGRAYVYLGSPSGLADAPVWVIEQDASSGFGHSADSAGDVNGDGYSDIIVGAPYVETGVMGAAYVYHGSVDGPNPTANWTAYGVHGDEQFGWSVGATGDVDGDGYGDVIIGAPAFIIRWQPYHSGRSFVYLGSDQGLGADAGWIGIDPHGDRSVYAAGYGRSVDGAGDANQDGYDDVLIGTYSDLPGPSAMAYLYLGGDQDWAMFVDDLELDARLVPEGVLLRAVVTVVHEGSGGVAGALVTISLSEEGGGSESMTQPTDGKGRAAFYLLDEDGGTWEVCVTDVVRDGYTYDPDQNQETCDTIGFLPGIIYVDWEAAGANDGSSWVDALVDLQAALDIALPGNEIWVAAGTYTPSAEHGGTGDRYRSFQMLNSVGIYGGFDPSVGDTGWEDRDWVENRVTLSGDIGTPGNPNDNCYHVFYHPWASDIDSTAILDGFVVSGGNANGSGSRGDGGGIYNDSDCSPTLTNCTFEGNSALDDGGGIYNGSDSGPVLTNCLFHGNSAGGNGGGLYTWIADPILTNCTFSMNSAGGSGGGIYGYGSSATLTNCILWGDEPDEVYDTSGSMLVTYSDIQGGYGGENIDADPQWVNPGAGDFHLSEDSPCIDTGTNDAPELPPTDFEGDDRIIDGDGDGIAAVDMGIDEALQPDSMHVGGMEGYFGLDPLGATVLRIHVLVEDQMSEPLSDVLVEASIWVPDGGPLERSRLTKPSGDARFYRYSRANGIWTLCVDDLSLQGYVYIPDDNVVTCMEWLY